MTSEPLKIMVVDENAARARAVEDALRSFGYQIVGQAEARDFLPDKVQQFQPDVVLIDVDTPSRDTLEQISTISRQRPRPIVMFTLDDDQQMIAAATRAGVSAYVVGGLAHARVKPIIDVAIARFKEFQSLKDELDRARTSLEERKIVDRAKGIIMEQRECPEPEAYRLLRRMAMDQKRRIVDVARELLMYHEYLKR